MSPSNQTASWLTALNQQRFSAITIVLLLAWALALTLYTANIQHSCQPLLEWTDLSQRQCSSEVTLRPRKPHPPDTKTPPSTPPVDPGGGEDEGRFEINLKEAAAIAVATVAVAGAIIIGAPVALIAGAGAIAWMAARSAMHFIQ